MAEIAKRTMAVVRVETRMMARARAAMCSEEAADVSKRTAEASKFLKPRQRPRSGRMLFLERRVD